MLKIVVKPFCLYWIDATSIKNYYGNIISKTRPFLCFNVKKIDKIKYYYFISGTSKLKKDIKIKQFMEYFCSIQSSKINNLEKTTLFQCNTIYVIPEYDLKKFFCGFIGRLSDSNETKIKKYLSNALNDRVWCISYYDKILIDLLQMQVVTFYILLLDIKRRKII